MEIQVTVLNKVADVVGKPFIVCDNSDYTIKFAFDSEWDAFPAKTAIFVYKRGAQYLSQEVTFSGDTVAVPPLQKVAGVSVGVYSGDVHTTTPAWIPCLASAKSHSAAHDNPPKDVYDQLVDLVNSGAVKGEDGTSPHIGDNGNWYIGDVDTGVPASGGTGSATWDSISGKPDTFPPSEHNHDDRYYTEQEIDSQIQNLRNEIPSLTGSITGITVNGTDLPVEDGKVALPIGSANNAGLFKTSLAHGITSYKDELRINPAAVSNIDSRSTPKPIVPSNLNYAVKAALTDEKRISGLTDAEKKNACNTIGSVYDGQYELIEEIALTEAVDNITRDTDTQGNAYNFRSVIIYAQLSANTENSTLRVYVNGLNDASITAQNAISTSTKYAKMVLSCNGGVISGININASTLSGTTNITSTPFLAVGHNAITSINIVSTKGIPSGTNIKIYAVGA